MDPLGCFTSSRGGALDLRAREDTDPLKVNLTAEVSNLQAARASNANKLDDKDASAFVISGSMAKMLLQATAR